ncbi:MAG: 2-C-methyl-D-erythritol 2,4-cyclodiphosphate synthase [Alphaproteobacteria bacterium]|nr:2-C-methyl-D-erythritol 2,4-cyclodiphosphate synthase [Alphaproteobacteria bacterium]
MSSISKCQNLKQDRGKVVALIMAAGSGSRFGGEIPKQFCTIGGIVPIKEAVRLFLSLDFISGVICVIPESHRHTYVDLVADIADERLLPAVGGGETRQVSVLNGLRALERGSPDYVLIHDACRCYCSEKLICDIYGALLNGAEAVVPEIPPVDAVRHGGQYLDKQQVRLVQTPQGFRYEMILQLHKRYNNEQFADDASLCARAGVPVAAVQGEQSNRKVTYRNEVGTMEYRTGYGYDVHRFSDDPNRKLYLMGHLIDGYRGLEGVSDADGGIHSLVDAILGALCLGGIGSHFPSNDPSNKGVSSLVFLDYCREKLFENGADIVNIDTTIICEEPKISVYTSHMKKIISNCLKIEPAKINIKGKTTEGMGFEGRKEGIAAISVVMIRKRV